eukprot:Gregarina_sp_Poly_1__1120@NODE_1274_length_4520_cov_241_024927_g133_i1_p4_GENE_NODE_1274_length_4520_cov_241_024927_g133_i1NODE_1274_length_4520_cov_241_024927_g133_i1_p4_ORF_typecomplete_len215_score24_57Abhydrolase_2/PF02230_16/6_9e54FSH1/PF03959_13/3_3e09Esterase_phd/PF10503_9/6_1e08Hydrolase_4/PF12146_8/18Hydrolase_4/PF12146_8/0_00012Peptidase_S9/PF00326_21/5_5e06Abhydrolase_6/PF12697_7/8_2e06DLH/PF01738_18/9_5e06Abhydrolase_3/PF07859_13/1_9e05Chlorophyllase2/PF12740_7/84Chlorophyllase2/PF12
MNKQNFQNGDSHGGLGLHRVPANSKYDRLIIFMHGLGDTAEGWKQTFVQFLGNEPKLANTTKVILPTAPVRPISLNGGMPMPGWSDIYSVDMDGREDVEGFMQSKSRILKIIETEIESAQLDPSKILVGGFSQGGALSYLVALSSTLELGGVIVCSGWIPVRNETLKNPTAVSTKIPILHCHGTGDDIVAFRYGSVSVKVLIEKGYQVSVRLAI